MAAAPRVALSSPPLQGGAFLHTLRSEKWRARRVLPSLYVPLDRRASMLFDLTRMVARQGNAPCSTA